MKARNNPRKFDTTNLDLPEGSKIFVNQSLCSFYRLLLSASKKLHDKGRIFSWYLSNGSIKIKLQENSRPLNIFHMEDFKKCFSDVDFQFVNKYYYTVCKYSTGCWVIFFLVCLFMSLLIFFVRFQISFFNFCLWTWNFQK